MPNSESNTDVVAEVRALADDLRFDIQPRVRSTLHALCDEVERLREQWNTRFNTLCGNCGKRYRGPRDEDKHGIGVCYA